MSAATITGFLLVAAPIMLVMLLWDDFTASLDDYDDEDDWYG